MGDPRRKYFEVNTGKRKAAGMAQRYGYLLRPAGAGASAWRDELGDVTQLKSNGTGVEINLTEGCVDFVYNATYNATVTLADLLITNVQLNHDRELSYSIYPHIHWLQEKDYTPNLLLEYRYQVNGGAKTVAWTKLPAVTLIHTYPGSAIHQISDSDPIVVPAGSNLSDIVQFRIYRDTGNASGEFAGACPYNTGGNASVHVLSFDVHIRIDQIGSTLEYTK